jgi:solute carrier family 35 protein F5
MALVPPYVVGIVSLFLVIALWSASNYAVAPIAAKDPNYGQPHFINYVNCCSMVIFLVFLVLPDPLQLYAKAVQRRKQLDGGGIERTLDTPSVRPSSEQSEKAEEAQEMQNKKPSWWMVALTGFPFAVLYFAANYFCVASFVYAYYSSATILSNASGLFSLVLGRICGVEELTIFKIISVVFTFSGVLFLKIFEATATDPMKRPWLGNLYSIISAFLYGCYSTYLKCVVGEGEQEDISGATMFGLVGLYSLVLFWPLLIVLWAMKEVSFTNPPSAAIILALLGNAFLGTVISNYAWTAALMFTGSVLVAIGLSFMSPVSVIVECIQGRRWPELYKLGSMVLILVGFFFVNLASIRPQWDRVILKTSKRK